MYYVVFSYRISRRDTPYISECINLRFKNENKNEKCSSFIQLFQGLWGMNHEFLTQITSIHLFCNLCALSSLKQKHKNFRQDIRSDFLKQKYLDSPAGIRKDSEARKAVSRNNFQTMKTSIQTLTFPFTRTQTAPCLEKQANRLAQNSICKILMEGQRSWELFPNVKEKT